MLIEILKSLRDTPLEDMSELLVMETNLTISFTTNWVIDSGSSVHLCTSIQDFKEYRRLRLREMTLRIGNGANIAAIVVRANPFQLPSDFCLELRDCYCVPNASKNLISISYLA